MGAKAGNGTQRGPSGRNQASPQRRRDPELGGVGGFRGLLKSEYHALDALAQPSSRRADVKFFLLFSPRTASGSINSTNSRHKCRQGNPETDNRPSARPKYFLCVLCLLCSPLGPSTSTHVPYRPLQLTPTIENFKTLSASVFYAEPARRKAAFTESSRQPIEYSII
jgi:hypothetical protein